MLIKMKYDTVVVEIDVEVNELTQWLNIDVIEEESEVELQKRIQEKINVDYNKPDYNNWHTHNRHIGYSKAVSEDGEESFDHFKEPLIDEVRDSRVFYKHQIDSERKQEYEYCCDFVAKHIQKQELAELFIKVIFEGYSLREIAMLQNPKEEGMSDTEYKKLIAKEENNLSHKLVRVRKKLKEVVLKTSDFDVPRGYLVEASKSSKKL